MSDLKPHPRHALLFPNGNIVVFDGSGNQISELQEAPIKLWAQRAERLGYSVEGLRVETVTGPVLELIRSCDGWTWMTHDRRTPTAI